MSSPAESPTRSGPPSAPQDPEDHRLPVWLSGLAEAVHHARRSTRAVVEARPTIDRGDLGLVTAAAQIRSAVRSMLGDLRAIDADLRGWFAAPATIEQTDSAAAAVRALAPLAAVADVYDEDGLYEARPAWGDNARDPDTIELLAGRGGRTLLTLEHAFEARRVMAELGGAS